MVQIMFLTQFSPISFLYSLKNVTNLWFSDVFRRYQGFIQALLLIFVLHEGPWKLQLFQRFQVFKQPFHTLFGYIIFSFVRSLFSFYSEFIPKGQKRINKALSNQLVLEETPGYRIRTLGEMEPWFKKHFEVTPQNDVNSPLTHK